MCPSEPVYRNKAWLREQIRLKLSLDEIATKAGVTRRTITNWLRRHKLRLQTKKGISFNHIATKLKEKGAELERDDGVYVVTFKDGEQQEFQSLTEINEILIYKKRKQKGTLDENIKSACSSWDVFDLEILYRGFNGCKYLRETHLFTKG